MFPHQNPKLGLSPRLKKGLRQNYIAIKGEIDGF
jgi:hypothetical protein